MLPLIASGKTSKPEKGVSMGVLFVNACLRGDESRTLRLCRAYLEGLPNVHEVDLGQKRLSPLYRGEVKFRAQLELAGVYDDQIFDLSKQFAHADEIVIGAPYWDLSFPAALKVYIEHVSVNDLTFHYTDEGKCEGLCNAKHLTYITTCGGSVKDANMGYDYICGIAKMFGIPETRFVAAENLDVIGADIEAIMADALARVEKLKANRPEI